MYNMCTAVTPTLPNCAYYSDYYPIALKFLVYIMKMVIYTCAEFEVSTNWFWIFFFFCDYRKIGGCGKILKKTWFACSSIVTKFGSSSSYSLWDPGDYVSSINRISWKIFSVYKSISMKFSAHGTHPPSSVPSLMGVALRLLFLGTELTTNISSE